jgi:hypothetical protein
MTAALHGKIASNGRPIYKVMIVMLDLGSAKSSVTDAINQHSASLR